MPDDDLPIPSQRVPEKRAGVFPPVVPPPVAENGRGVLPADLQHQVNTWARHAGKILQATNQGTLSVSAGTHFCVITRDQATVVAITAAIQSVLSAQRQREDVKP